MKEAAVAELNVLFGHMPVDTEYNYKILEW
jgi:hypothetical protein